ATDAGLAAHGPYLSPSRRSGKRMVNQATMLPPRPPVRTIDRDELRAKLAGRDPFKLVMTMNEWGYRTKHIPGSLHFNTPEQMLAALGKDEDIVVYCSNVDCHASVAAYYALLD